MKLCKSRGKRIKKNEESLWEMWDIIKYTIIFITGIQEEERKKKIESKFKKIIPVNFLNLLKNNNLHSQETQWTPGRINAKRNTNISQQDWWKTKRNSWKQQEKNDWSLTMETQ